MINIKSLGVIIFCKSVSDYSSQVIFCSLFCFVFLFFQPLGSFSVFCFFLLILLLLFLGVLGHYFVFFCLWFPCWKDNEKEREMERKTERKSESDTGVGECRHRHLKQREQERGGPEQNQPPEGDTGPYVTEGEKPQRHQFFLTSDISHHSKPKFTFPGCCYMFGILHSGS